MSKWRSCLLGTLESHHNKLSSKMNRLTGTWWGIKKVLAVIVFAFVALCSVSVATAALPSSVSGVALPSLADMLEKVMPAVVDITTEGTKPGITQSKGSYRRLFGTELPEKARGTGSGIIIDKKNGYIVTNAHVILGALKITVSLADGREFVGKVIGTDTDADVGVLQIKPERLNAIKLANSKKLRVGDFVVAVGNPFGLGQTATSGIVSALGRSGLGIEAYENFIQTDAPINPGNSGGALVNLRGELIGINTAILGGRSGGSVGIGFAIPSNMVRNIKDQLIQNGEVVRGQLGVEIQNLTPELVKKFGLKSLEGALISRVVIDSPADQAGLRSSDVIIQVNSSRVRNSVSLKNIIGNLRIGAMAPIEFIRNGNALITVAEINKVDNRNGFR